MKDFIKLLRPWQWTKNLFIFLPLFFALQINHLDLVIKAGAAFLIFCLITSSIYIFNDWHDVEDDRLHPEKRLRPLASGKISKKVAGTAITVFSTLGLILSYCLGHAMLSLVAFYMVLNVAYTLKLKHISIMDIFIIASGFVIRIFIGGVVTHIKIYPWIIIMTFLLSLFLALGKRRDDVLILLESNNKTRKSLDGYNLQFLDMTMMAMAAITIVAYIMYTMSTEVMARFRTDKLYFTTLFVILGIMRYMKLILVEKKSGDPTEILLKDRFLQYTILCWIISFGILIYL
ncbi:MAG: decaprenyl-phosphate phosphoribosyltransferase [Desulfobacteraceae bacterium]|nr:decaprenyl-phosphate phosphoribosyltransferase [Desulfobacteraceae bacterium]MBU4053936.1 decaprenyl-phosphate phosphoribosyltransferase [Pseudomonadota bacterium]